MDEEKGIQHHKEHKKDISTSNSDGVFFINHEKVFIVSKKVEKLSTAVYLVTDFLSEKEPMKWGLREKSLSFLSFILSSFGNRELIRSGGFNEQVKRMINEVILFLEIASQARLISLMNFCILKEEYQKTGVFIENILGNKDSIKDIVFPQNFFSQEVLRNVDNDDSRRVILPTQSKRHADYKRQNVSEMSFMDIKNGVNEKKSNREDMILKIIKTKGEVSIKDLSLIISDCSEKTIQRELMFLIQKDVLERRGERRWSTYRLKQRDLATGMEKALETSQNAQNA